MQLMLNIYIITIIVLINYSLSLRLNSQNRHSNSTSIWTNSLGQRIPNSQIKKPPFEITRCDQVVFVNGQRFENEEDVTKRVDAFYTLGVYIVNMFESNSTDRLIISIDNTNSMDVPELIPGTKTCLNIHNKQSVLKFPMCLENEEILLQIQEVFRQFSKCRFGLNLGPDDLSTACTEEQLEELKALLKDESYTPKFLTSSQESTPLFPNTTSMDTLHSAANKKPPGS